MDISRIEKIIKNNGLTFSTIEKILGFGNGSIAKWVNSSPSIDKIIKIAKHFNVSADYLLYLSDFPDLYKNELSEERRITREIFMLSGEKQRQLVDYLEFIKTKE